MSALRFSLLLARSPPPVLGGCRRRRYSTLPVPGVPAARDADAATSPSPAPRPRQAQRGMSNHTWFWTRGAGRRRSTILQLTDGISSGWSGSGGSWPANGRSIPPPTQRPVIVQICLRYPGVCRAGSQPQLELPSRRHDVHRDAGARGRRSAAVRGPHPGAVRADPDPGQPRRGRRPRRRHARKYTATKTRRPAAARPAGRARRP